MTLALPITRRDECWSTWMLEDEPWSPALYPESSQQYKCWSTWLLEEDPLNEVSQPQLPSLETTPDLEHHECWSTWLADEDPWNEASQPLGLEQQSRSQNTGDDDWCGADDLVYQASWANDQELFLPKLEMPNILKDRESRARTGTAPVSSCMLGVSRKMLFPNSIMAKLPTSFMAGSVWGTRTEFVTEIADSVKVSSMSLCSTPSMPPDSQSSQTWSDSMVLDSHTSQSLTPSMPADSESPQYLTPSMPPDSSTSEESDESEADIESFNKPRTTGAIWYRRHLKLEEASNPFCLYLVIQE